MASGSVDGRRAFEPGGPVIGRGVETNHPGTSVEVARSLSVIEAQPAPLESTSIELGGGRLRMDGKASDSFQATWYTL